MVLCSVLRTGFGGPLCAKKSRATLWPQSAPAQKFTLKTHELQKLLVMSVRVNSQKEIACLY